MLFTYHLFPTDNNMSAALVAPLRTCSLTTCCPTLFCVYQGIEFLSAPADIADMELDSAGLTDAGGTGGARTALVGTGTSHLTASDDVTGARDFEREGNQVRCALALPCSHWRGGGASMLVFGVASSAPSRATVSTEIHSALFCLLCAFFFALFTT